MTLYTDETYGPRSAACKLRTGHRCVVCCRRRAGTQSHHMVRAGSWGPLRIDVRDGYDVVWLLRWWPKRTNESDFKKWFPAPLVALCARHHRAVHRWDKRLYGPPLWLVTYLYVVVRWTALGFAGCIVIGVAT